MKKRGLGRNLEMLLSRKTPLTSPVTITPIIPAKPLGSELKKLPIEQLQRGRYQPRQHIVDETIHELAESIKKQGVLQPILVRRLSDNRYEIVAGERRWRAAQQAGLSEVPTLIKEVSDEDTLAIALIENIQRENLNPLEEALALQRLADEFGLTHDQISEAVGKSRSLISNLLRLLNLTPEVKALLEQNQLEMGHARALLALSGLAQVEAANKVVIQNLSVRETEKLVKYFDASSTKKTHHVALDPDIRALQRRLAETLGTKVIFQTNAKGKGKMVIHYNNLDQLEGILGKIEGIAA